MTKRQSTVSKAYARAGFEDEALEEARQAVEQIVVPLNSAVELLPRTAAVMVAQAELLLRYKLGYEMVGEGEKARLRILPRSAAVDTAPAQAEAEASDEKTAGNEEVEEGAGAQP